MTEVKEKRSWDMGLDYHKTERTLRRAFEYRRDLADKFDRKGITLTKVSALYTQLVNGSRISEACEALKKFHETGDREVKVRIAKQSEEQIEKQGYIRYREMLIPELIKRKHIQPEQLEPSKITSYCINVFGFNTHSLRYAFIGMMSSKGIAPQVIANITGHRNLEHIIEYSQKVQANELHQEVVYAKKK